MQTCSTKAYVVSRFVFEKLPPVTIAVERVLKSSLDPTPTSTFQRARVLMTSMSMVICLWRVLNKGEQRRDIILKAHKALTGGRYQSCEAPVACVDSALQTAVLARKVRDCIGAGSKSTYLRLVPIAVERRLVCYLWGGDPLFLFCFCLHGQLPRLRYHDIF